jgi:hypothetical protein
MNIYQENGFATRREYLEDLAYQFGAEFEQVVQLAGVLGASEDFDGLVTTLEDAEYCGYFD